MGSIKKTPRNKSGSTYKDYIKVLGIRKYQRIIKRKLINKLRRDQCLNQLDYNRPPLSSKYREAMDPVAFDTSYPRLCKVSTPKYDAIPSSGICSSFVLRICSSFYLLYGPTCPQTAMASWRAKRSFLASHISAWTLRTCLTLDCLSPAFLVTS